MSTMVTTLCKSNLTNGSKRPVADGQATSSAHQQQPLDFTGSSLNPISLNPSGHVHCADSWMGSREFLRLTAVC